MTIPESLGEALLVDETLKSKPVARRRREGRFILYKINHKGHKEHEGRRNAQREDSFQIFFVHLRALCG